MNKTWTRILILTLAFGCAAVPAAWAATASATGSAGQTAVPPAAPDDPFGNWIEHFDTYATGSQMHGQGGWKGWDNNPAAGALTSSAQALSPLNSVDILGATDLVHEYTGYSGGTWTYTARQFIPSGFTGQTYFILLNTYADLGTNNWSTQVCFNGALGTVIDDIAADCAAASTVSIVYDQWVEIRVVIDLDTNSQSFFYNGQLLYTDSWTEHISTGGTLNLAAVDLFANSAPSVFYDDISLSNLPFTDGFESGDTNEWHSTVP